VEQREQALQKQRKNYANKCKISEYCTQPHVCSQVGTETESVTVQGPVTCGKAKVCFLVRNFNKFVFGCKVPVACHIFWVVVRRQRTTQKITCDIRNMAKAWNQEFLWPVRTWFDLCIVLLNLLIYKALSFYTVRV
jgi:hypothetical protein